MALNVSGLEYEHREVALRDKPQAMLKASPKGTVPVFVTDKGKVIDESLAVMRYALSKNDPENWLSDTSRHISDTETFLTLMDNEFKFHLDRYKYASRYDENANRGDVDLKHRAQAIEILLKWETALSQSSYLLGETATLSDIATFPFIRQFAATERKWWESRPLPYVADWLEGFVQSDRFKAIMKKRPLWPTESVSS
jgi:glutathione S-transferase